MSNVVLNGSLASGLGRPDLAYTGQGASAIQTGVPPLTSVVASDGGTWSFEGRAPTVALFLLVAGLTVFAVWVHPHLK